MKRAEGAEEAFWRGRKDKEREEVGGGQGRRKGWKIGGGIERGQRERRVQSFKRALPAPSPSFSDPRSV